MKTGDRYTKFEDLQEVMRKELGVAFTKFKAWIPHLPKPNHDVCCAKHVFYNKDFPKVERWNEFKGISKCVVAANWNDTQWIKSDATAVIHEIPSPLINTVKPGAGSKGLYEPVLDENSATKRLIFGNFRESAGNSGNNYVFLGVYELDMLACKNLDGYRVDAACFPRVICKMDSSIITYPHQVWKRISDVWGK